MNRLVVVLLTSFAFFISAHATVVTEQMLNQQLDYIDQERKAMSCAIAKERGDALNDLGETLTPTAALILGRKSLWDQVPFGVKGSKAKVSSAIYEALESANCELYPNQVVAPETKGGSFIPLYSEIPENINTLACAYTSLADYKTCEFAREDYLKPYFLKVKSRCDIVPTRAGILTDASFWHKYLLNNGYPCTAENFREANMRFVQNRILQKRIGMNLDRIKTLVKGKPLAGLSIALVPPLAYERSYFRNMPYNLFGGSGGAEVSPSQMVSGLKKLGAKKVYFIDRITSDRLANQIAQTLPELKKINAKEKDGFITLTWSYGSAVMAKILRDHEAELTNLRGVINYGGTPHGSVIGEYKSRLDYFIKRQTLPGAEKVIGQSTWIDLLDDIDPFISDTIDDSILNSVKRANLLELSYKNPDLHDPAREAAVEIPVVNYILLNPDEASRANALRDPVYQNMVAYGPTEGSSRLVDAAFRSKNSYTVFMDDMGHLAFLYLDKERTTEVILAPLYTAVEMGVFN